MQTTRYNAEPALRRPAQMVRDMAADLRASRELGWRLFLRDLKAKYRASLLGYVWVVLPPLAVTATFLLLQQAKVMNVGELPVPYALYVLAGTTFWQLFADAVQAPLKIVSQSKSMLVKINFPREALILAAALESLFTFAIRLTILCLCLPFFGLALDPGLLAMPVAVVGLLVSGLAIGVLLTPFGILFQDFSQGLPLALSVWLIATPIAYPASQASGFLQTINKLNPLTPLIDWPRSLFLPIDSSASSAALALTAVMLGIALLAWILFRIALPHIIARIGS